MSLIFKIKSAVWNVKFMPYLPNSTSIDAFHGDWMWLDAEEDICVNSHTYVNNKLATCGIWNTDELCDDCVGGSTSREKREINTTVNQ